MTPPRAALLTSAPSGKGRIESRATILAHFDLLEEPGQSIARLAR